MAAIDMVWPHSYAVIFENTSGKRLDIPWLGRRGLILQPDDKVAIIGNPLVNPPGETRYNAKKHITALAELIADGMLSVLSIPGGDKEADNTSVPMVDDELVPLPGCKIDV